MKLLRYAGAFLIALTLASGVVAPQKVQAQPGVSVSFDMFFGALAPYGRWTSHPQYGSVWYPAVDRNFHPYSTNGRWVMTQYGNTWVSNYEWGWAPFHYGRWFYDDFYGWAWVPDYTWGPGWVNWRTGGDYYGWAPLMPGLQVRIAINLPINFWVFVPQRYFTHNAWHSHIVPRGRVQNIYNNTTIINNYYYNDRHEYSYGPRHDEIERRTGSSVPVYDYSRSSNNGRYQEVVNRSNRSSQEVLGARERSFESNNGSARVTNGASYDRTNGSTSRSASEPVDNYNRGRESGYESTNRSSSSSRSESTYPGRSSDVSVPSRSSGSEYRSETTSPRSSRTSDYSAPTYRSTPAPSSGNSGSRSSGTSRSGGSYESARPSGGGGAPAPASRGGNSGGAGRSSGESSGNTSRSR